MSDSIDVCVEQSKEQKKGTVLEKITVSKAKEPEEIKPISDSHVIKFLSREIDLPDSPKQQEMPVIPDQKKADADYNSIDYQIIAFNLWRSKERN